MNRNWENTFSGWKKPPGKTEEDRCEDAIRAIRNAINKSPILKHRSMKIFPQGSYRNRVNVRQDSDVDVGVLCDESFIAFYPEGTSRETFGNVEADYTYKEFKDELEVALVDYFGRSSVHRGNKAFDIKENTYHVDADVAPFFEYRYYWEDGTYRCGVALRPDNGGKVHNYPERLLESWPNTPLHYENGVSKNKETNRSYKGIVRILKKVRNEMEETGIAAAKPIPGFLIECMVWNVPNSCFSHDTWDKDVQAVLQHLWSNTKDDARCKSWHEVNDIKFLFHSTQKWRRDQAHEFIDAAWDYVGVRK
jgi:hypothetical protein